MALSPRLNSAWWTLRIGFGLVPIFAGLDKYFNLLTNWEMYLNPLIPRTLHISAPAFMHIVGVIEIVAGILILTRLTRYAAYIVMAVVHRAQPRRFLDIAVRDIAMSLGAFALAKLTEAREPAEETATGHAPAGIQRLA